MLGFVKEIFNNAVTNAAQNEANSMSTALAALDNTELLLFLPHIAQIRFGMLSEGADLLDPWRVVADEPRAPDILYSLMTKLKRDKDHQRANAMAVWVFTLRGAANPHLRGPARAIWAELSRAFRIAHALADRDGNPLLREMTKVPVGFEPRPAPK